MNRIKNIVFPILFLIISVAVLCFSFMKIGLLPSIDIEFFTEITNVEKPIKDNNQLIDELKRAYLTNERDLSLPNNLNAIWLNLNKDLVVSSESSTNDVKYEIYSSFDYFRNFVPNAIFLKPDTENEFSHLLEPDGSSFDIFAYTLFYAKTIDLFRFLVIDDDLIYNEKGEFSNIFKISCITLHHELFKKYIQYEKSYPVRNPYLYFLHLRGTKHSCREGNCLWR